MSYIKLGPRAYELLNSINPAKRVEFELFDEDTGVNQKTTTKSSKSKPAALEFNTINEKTVSL